MIAVYIIMFLFIGVVSYLWVRGIDNMKKNHSDYKGEDFLDWNEDEEKE